MTTVLIVEDEMYLAMMAEDILLDAGHQVFKAARLPNALALAAAERFDAALLDINLAGVEVFPLAEELRRRGVPFTFTSGYGTNGIPPDYRDYPVLQKPYIAEQLVDTVTAMLASGEADRNARDPG
ncbi:MAG: response regulator [Luteimonas sp.]